MANNNGLNVLDAITAAKLAKGGGSGEVTKKYVDDGLALKQDKTMSASVTIGAETETTVEGAIGELADLVPSTAAPTTNKLATVGDVNGEEITVTASTSPVPTASGSLRKIAIFGKSEVVDGDIHSAGEGYGVVRLADLTWSWWDKHPNIIYAQVAGKQLGLCNMICSAYPYNQNTSFSYQYESAYSDKTIYCSQNTDQVYIKNTDYNTKEDFVASLGDATLCYQLADPTQGNCVAVKTDNGSGIDGTMAVFETGTPLRGIPGTAVKDSMQWDGTNGKVIKRCEVVNGEVVALSTPVEIPLTAAEIAQFNALQTYFPQTAIAINDSPEFEVEAYAGTANGKAVAELEERVQKQIEDKITVSSTLTLAANGWSNNTQTVTFAHDTTKHNAIDITPSEVPAWAAAGVYASAETSTGITFTCATVPKTVLTFKVTSMEVS